MAVTGEAGHGLLRRRGLPPRPQMTTQTAGILRHGCGLMPACSGGRQAEEMTLSSCSYSQLMLRLTLLVSVSSTTASHQPCLSTIVAGLQGGSDWLPGDRRGSPVTTCWTLCGPRQRALISPRTAGFAARQPA